MELLMFFVVVISTILGITISIEEGIFRFIFWCTIFIVFKVFTYTRINGFLIVNKREKTISQSISFKICFKNLFRNVFDNGRSLPKRSYSKELMRTNIKGNKDKLEIYLKNNSGKTFKTYTNDEMLSQLRKYEKKGIIEIKTIQPVKKNSQKLARICYVGIGTIIYNCRNKIFKDYIKEEINVGRYRIIIK